MSKNYSFDDDKSGQASTLLAEPADAVERARYIGSFPHQSPHGIRKKGAKWTTYSDRQYEVEDRARTYMLVHARNVRDSERMEDWLEYTSAYPKIALTEEEMRQKGNPDVLVRAHYVFEAVSRLLELANAPESLKVDFELLVKKRRPKSVPKRAKAQELILKILQQASVKSLNLLNMTQVI
ncbi:hypothetical protein EUU23_09465 [Sphingorhabdus sp. IMCC26285]|uniref:Uncharacterized protein n=1 Tax=Sphingorhabdus profundilacus TaxID=2509718 RepID=A0A6I4M109_9SPHN|nr:hypothetical protein [Sphingorhabdus profundilacus]MVZ97934.1 hypothetical protein [Sphingorhabdus profundilacus]